MLKHGAPPPLHVARAHGWRYDHRRPPPEGPQGEGLPMPEPYRPLPRTHVPARLRYSKPAVQLSPKSYFVYLFRWHQAIVKAIIGVIGAHDLGSEGSLKSGGEAQRIQLVRGFAAMSLSWKARTMMWRDRARGT